MDVSRYNVDDVVSGKVVSVKDFGMFVRIKPGFDVLCPPPREEEAVVGYNAVIKLTQLHNEKENCRPEVNLFALFMCKGGGNDDAWFGLCQK